MTSPLLLLGPFWRVQRQRHPRAAARLEATSLGLRGDLAGEVHALRTRVAELERDHLLLAAHVAALTERLDIAARAEPVDAGAQAARQRARLSAMAFYEERIGRLEEHLARGGLARVGQDRKSARRTSGERAGAGS